MRKKSFVLALLCIFYLGLNAQQIALEDIWLRYQYIPQSPSNFRWMADDQYYSVMEKGGIARYSIETGEKVDDVLRFAELELGDFAPSDIDSYSFNQ
ncbi:MAG: hypothetical protein AAFQ68_25690, partial [Bacteroidota bacterium]